MTILYILTKVNNFRKKPQNMEVLCYIRENRGNSSMHGA